jgi:hypothetical protein
LPNDRSQPANGQSVVGILTTKEIVYLSVVHEPSAFGGPASEIAITQGDGAERPKSVERDRA